MKAEEVALAAVWLAAGMVGAFVAWTYIAPHLAGVAASTSQPTA